VFEPRNDQDPPRSFWWQDTVREILNALNTEIKRECDFLLTNAGRFLENHPDKWVGDYWYFASKVLLLDQKDECWDIIKDFVKPGAGEFDPGRQHEEFWEDYDRLCELKQRSVDGQPLESDYEEEEMGDVEQQRKIASKKALQADLWASPAHPALQTRRKALESLSQTGLNRRALYKPDPLANRITAKIREVQAGRASNDAQLALFQRHGGQKTTYDSMLNRVPRRFTSQEYRAADLIPMEDPMYPGRWVEGEILGICPIRPSFLAVALDADPDCQLSRAYYVDCREGTYKKALEMYMEDGANRTITEGKLYILQKWCRSPEQLEINCALYLPWGRRWRGHVYAAPRNKPDRQFMMFSETTLGKHFTKGVAKALIERIARIAGQQIPINGASTGVQPTSWCVGNEGEEQGWRVADEVEEEL